MELLAAPSPASLSLLKNEQNVNNHDGFTISSFNFCSSHFASGKRAVSKENNSSTLSTVMNDGGSHLSVKLQPLKILDVSL